jgi:hypothetical protein
MGISSRTMPGSDSQTPATTANAATHLNETRNPLKPSPPGFGQALA